MIALILNWKFNYFVKLKFKLWKLSHNYFYSSLSLKINFMKKFALIILFFLVTSSLLSQGLIKDLKSSELIKKNPRVKIDKTRSLNVLTSYSLEKYTPHVFDQAQSDMCAAYSLALARTIIYARNNNLLNKNKISAEAYSPYYIYTKYKS